MGSRASQLIRCNSSMRVDNCWRIAPSWAVSSAMEQSLSKEVGSRRLLFLSGGGRLYGRYWGCVREIPGLHFEAAYYQGIDYCIRNGISVFESGAQGEHKVSRGFMPAKTRSWHYVGNEAFRDAIGIFLSRETDWLDEYRDELLRHDPYRQDER